MFRIIIIRLLHTNSQTANEESLSSRPTPHSTVCIWMQLSELSFRKLPQWEHIYFLEETVDSESVMR